MTAGPDIDDRVHDAAVIGAGVLGLACAAELASRGADVVTIDPGGPNASSIAAGMIAPALESLAEAVTFGRAALLRQAAALWPGFAERHGLTLDETPAEWVGSTAEAAARLEKLGFVVQPTARGVEVDDRRIEVGPALRTLSTATPRIRDGLERLERTQIGWRLHLSESTLTARFVVVATGTSPAPPGASADVAERMGRVRPVAGQIGWTPEVLVDRVTRSPEVYLVPADGGTLIGATMRPGRDLTVDRIASRRLVEAAERLSGRPVGPVTWRVGVRGAVADGLPLAGPCLWRGEGSERIADLALALAPRRNGWLTAPAVAALVAEAWSGRWDEDLGDLARAFAPMRPLGPSLPAG